MELGAVKFLLKNCYWFMSWKINEKLGRHETTYNAYEFYVEDLQSLAISRKYYFQRERERESLFKTI